MNTNKHQIRQTGKPRTLTLDFFRAAPADDQPNRLLIFLFVQLRFDRGFDFFVKRLVVLQDFFCGVATLG